MSILKNRAPVAKSIKTHSAAAIHATIERLESRTLLTTAVVNTTIDALFPPNTGLVSLRNAIATANSSSSPTTITFDAKVFAAAQTITMDGQLLELTNASEPTTITGPTTALTVSGNNQSRGFQIDRGVNATFSGLTIVKCNGSGMFNAGTVTLTHVTVSGNTASTNGGGIYNSGIATMTSVIVENNTANNSGTKTRGGGGGIYNSGTATLTNVTISNNSASASGQFDDGGGGGILNDSGTINLSGVTISNNMATGPSFEGGGGILNFGIATLTKVNISTNTAPSSLGGGIFNAATATLANVIIASNTSASAGGFQNYTGSSASLTDVTISGNIGNNGGGIGNLSGTLTLTNVTVSGNTSPTGSGGGLKIALGRTTLNEVTISGNSAATKGGGISVEGTITPTSTPTISNSIIAGNRLTGSGSGPDVYGPVNSLAFNLIGATDSSTGWNAGDFTGTIAHPLSPKLGPLAVDGGFTDSMLPLAGSPAIDKGSNALIPKGITTDQRGLPRIVHSIVDIGAVEAQPSIVVTPPAKQSATQGKSVSVALGSFTQFAGTSPFKVDINWGDGSADTILTLSAAGTIPATAHTFAKAGTLTVSETITDAKNVKSNTATFTDVVTAVTGSISGRVFADVNSNGVRDSGEPGLGLFTVDLETTTGTVLKAATTDVLGDFTFTGLVAGSYLIKVVPVTGLEATKPTGGTMTITLTAGQIKSGLLFGEKATS